MYTLTGRDVKYDLQRLSQCDNNDNNNNDNDDNNENNNNNINNNDNYDDNNDDDDGRNHHNKHKNNNILVDARQTPVHKGSLLHSLVPEPVNTDWERCQV